MMKMTIDTVVEIKYKMSELFCCVSLELFSCISKETVLSVAASIVFFGGFYSRKYGRPTDHSNS